MAPATTDRPATDTASGADGPAPAGGGRGGSRAGNVLTVVRKELRGYLDSPTAYIAAAIFLVLLQFLFFRDVFLIGEASIRGMFSFLPWLFLLLIPALTMGSISQERREGTLELLLTHPLRDGELVLGKYLAPLLFTAATLAFVVPVAWSLDRFGDLDWGIVAGQYLGAVLLASVLVALGILLSTVLASQVSALLTTAAAGFALIIVGMEMVTARLPLRLAPVVEQLSALTHFESMARGVIDVRDLWYFISASAVFLALAWLQLRRRRFGNRRSRYRSVQAAVAMFVAIAIVTNVIGQRIPGRIDLTEGGLYTLTDATRSTLTGLDDVVRITFYASERLPAGIQSVRRDIEDTLRDYDTIGRGNVVVRRVDPTGDEEAAEQAQAAGVQEVQFNVVGNEEFELRRGFLGIAVSYAGATEALPFIQDTRDLEYDLTSTITRMTATDKPRIGLASGFGMGGAGGGFGPDGMPQQGAYGALQQELSAQFDVVTVELAPEEGEGELDSELAALVVAGPTEELGAGAREAIDGYLEEGGSALVMLDAVSVDLQTFSAQVNEDAPLDLASDLGVQVAPDIAFDLQANQTAQFQTGQGLGFVTPYPLWPRAIASEEHPVTRSIEQVVMRWASTLSVDEEALAERGQAADVLLSTTEAGGTIASPFDLNPQAALPQDSLGEQVLAVAIAPAAADDEEGTAEEPAEPASSRLVVVGDSDFLSDQFLQQNPENLVFGMEAISWLSQEASLAAIKARDRVTRQLQFDDQAAQTRRIKWGNAAFVLLVIGGLGGWRLLRRRRLARTPYVALG